MCFFEILQMGTHTHTHAKNPTKSKSRKLAGRPRKKNMGQTCVALGHGHVAGKARHKHRSILRRGTFPRHNRPTWPHLARTSASSTASSHYRAARCIARNAENDRSAWFQQAPRSKITPDCGGPSCYIDVSADVFSDPDRIHTVPRSAPQTFRNHVGHKCQHTEIKIYDL